MNEVLAWIIGMLVGSVVILVCFIAFSVVSLDKSEIKDGYTFEYKEAKYKLVKVAEKVWTKNSWVGKP